MQRRVPSLVLCILSAVWFAVPPRVRTSAENGPLVHGLWVWKSQVVLADPRGAEKLRDFCKTQQINEVYVSVSAKYEPQEEHQLAALIGMMHSAGIHVEALLTSADADEPGKHRDTLLDHMRMIVQFNDRHSGERFDGVHLDIEPWQSPENKGPGNLRFLPGLVDAYHEARRVADAAHLSISADIQNKLLKGDLAQRQMLMTALPRFTLMLYEVSSPTDGDTPEQKQAKLRDSSQKFLDMTYQGLKEPHLAKMVIGLRQPDYLDLLPQMLNSLDEENRGNPHYAGWSRHAYGDYLKMTQ
jgi:hypothetical protein